jgi:hypothetical protein
MTQKNLHPLDRNKHHQQSINEKVLETTCPTQVSRGWSSYESQKSDREEGASDDHGNKRLADPCFSDSAIASGGYHHMMGHSVPLKEITTIRSKEGERMMSIGLGIAIPRLVGVKIETVTRSESSRNKYRGI